MVRHRVNMHKCIVCDLPITTPMEPVVIECTNTSCNQPCIHVWIEHINQYLCSVCKSIVGENRSTPILESENTHNDNRNNLPAANRTRDFGCIIGIILNMDPFWLKVLKCITILLIICFIIFIIF